MTTFPQLPCSAKHNIQTLCDAVRKDRICIVSTIDAKHSQPAMLICAVNHSPEDALAYELVPLALLFDGDPYSRFVPPFSDVEPTHD